MKNNYILSEKVRVQTFAYMLNQYWDIQLGQCLTQISCPAVLQLKKLVHIASFFQGSSQSGFQLK